MIVYSRMHYQNCTAEGAITPESLGTIGTVRYVGQGVYIVHVGSVHF